MKKRIVLSLIAGMMLLSGCGGIADTVSEKAGGNTEETVKMTEQENESAEEGTVPEDKGEGEKRGEKEGEKEGNKSAEGDEAEEAKESRYTWQEITVTLPQSWEGRCIMVEGENGFSIYQKASYEKDSTLGYVCGFRRTQEPVEDGIGEILLAYTEDGVLYYLFPSLDFASNTEDEKTAGEYLEMCLQVPRLKDSVQFAVPGIHCDAEEYVLPTSSIFRLNQRMLENLSDNSLWIARNEIYARHGRQFANEYLQQYFNRCTWYEGTITAGEFQESTLSRIEKDNLKLLKAAEQEYDRQHPYPKRYQAEGTAVEDLTGDGTADEISYQVTEEENGGYRCRITVNGETYDASELSDYESDVMMSNPIMDHFYVTDVLEQDGMLEIAVFDEGPSEDSVTYFFRYDGTLSCIGRISGIPFAEMNGGFNGFNGVGGITGDQRIDLIETAYLQDYWWYVHNRIIRAELGDLRWYDFWPTRGHILYEDLPVYCERDESSDIKVIPAQEEVFFLGSDGDQWILVKGKDGSRGYMLVEDGNIVNLNKPADQVFSDLQFSD